MNKELIIKKHDKDVDIALLEDNVLVELHKDRTDVGFMAGDIYLGRVKKNMPGLNACFLDIGHEKNAFMIYVDLGTQFRSLMKFTSKLQAGSLTGKDGVEMVENFKLEQEVSKTGKIANEVSANQLIPVQIVKEAISTKGPRVSSDIAIAGRYLVLIPFSNKISISQKIKQAEERSRLKTLVKSIKPDNFGIIIRTMAESRMVVDLYNDLEDLQSKWNKVVKNLAHAKPLSILLSEIDRANAILRDVLNETFNSINVNDQKLFDDTKEYLKQIAPEKVDILKLYKGKGDIFEFYGVEKQIRNSFGKIVTIKNGIYMYIEKTEALHVIDVNSGPRANNNQDSIEENALAVNLEAGREIARQLRLRDLGGIIVIDFIDLAKASDRKLLFDSLVEEMANDKARHTVLPPTKFGLIQITRQRIRPEVTINDLEKCPTCHGTGIIKPSMQLEEDIEETLQYLVQEQNEKNLTLGVHPFVFAYLNQGLVNSLVKKWQRKYHVKLKLCCMKNYNILDFWFFNNMMEEINL